MLVSDPVSASADRHTWHNEDHRTGEELTPKKVDVESFRTPVSDLGLEVSHPCVCNHPVTGRPALYVNRGFTIRFDDWTRDESRDLLNYLVDHATTDELVYQHRWEAGDVVVRADLILRGR